MTGAQGSCEQNNSFTQTETNVTAVSFDFVAVSGSVIASLRVQGNAIDR